MLVFDYAAFAAQQRIQNRIHCGDGNAVEPNGPGDEDVASARGQAEGLQVAVGA